MYKQRITEPKTKQYYKTILSDTIRMLEEEKSASGGYEMYDDILAELYDVKRNVIDSYNYSDPEEIFEKYTFGAIGVVYLIYSMARISIILFQKNRSLVYDFYSKRWQQ